MADKTESEKFYGCLNSAGRIVLILIAGAVMLFVVVVLVGTCGCTSTAITGDAAVEIPAEETYSADAEYVPDVVAEPPLAVLLLPDIRRAAEHLRRAGIAFGPRVAREQRQQRKAACRVLHRSLLWRA